MNGSTALEGVPGNINALLNDGGAAAGDEVTEHVHGVFPLPMGMEREDRCE